MTAARTGRPGGAARPLPLRRARGAVVGLVGAVLAVAGHAAGGATVVAPLVPVVVAAVVAACVAASASRWTPARLLAALVGTQVAVHLALWLVSPTSTGALDPRLAGSVAPAAHAGHAADHGPGLAMLAAHAAATVVAVLLLGALEALALTVVALLRRVPPRRVVTVPAVARPWAVAVGVPSLRPSLLARRAPRRGPPVAAAC